MSRDEIKLVIATSNWFSALGRYAGSKDRLSLADLHAWDQSIFTARTDKCEGAIAGNMEWLPSSRDQEDPIHGIELISLLEKTNPGYASTVLDLHKSALISLRAVPENSIMSGPNDFTQAAIGSALYCVRMAALESLANVPGFWCDVLKLYSDGFWPCGLMPDRRLVVY